MTAPLPADEAQRLEFLRSLNVLDSSPEQEFDDLVRLASTVLDVPVALVSLVDEDRQWFKARVGLDACETSREVSFCAHALAEAAPLVIPDTTLDARFSDNPLVTGDPGVRFYTGAPIVVEGYALGTVCGIDWTPRRPSPRQIDALAALARQAAALVVARRRAESYARSEAQFLAFLDHAPALAFLKDDAGRMRYANRRHAEVFGYEPGTILGKTDTERMPSEFAERLREHDRGVLREGRTIHRDETVPLPDGTPLVWDVRKFPLEIDGETWVGGVAIDVTASRAAEATVAAQAVELQRALAAAEAATGAVAMAAMRFEQLFAGLPVACYTFDTEGIVQEWNGAAEALFGVPSHVAFLNSVCGTVAEETCAHVRDNARRVLAGESILGEEAFITLLDGSTRWMLTNTFPIRSTTGTIVGGVSAHIDVTGRKRSEDALREKEERFRTVVESLHEGLVVQDAEGQIQLCNPSATRIFGAAIEGKNIHEERKRGWRLIRPGGAPLEPDEHPTALALRDGKPREGTVIGVERSDAEVRWLSVNSIPLARGGETSPTEVVSSFVDITERLEQERFIEEQMVQISGYSAELELQKYELEEANRRLVALATTDGLTGLKNHRYFQDYLRRKVENCGYAGLPISLALLDVDRFKGYNDDFGHQAGDAVLRGVAEVLSQSVRGSELVARYGGEEFVIVMPGLDEAQAVALAERVRRRLAETPFDLRAVTASFGVACFGGELRDAANLIKAADEALYASKTAGRNRVTAWRSSQMAVSA